MKLICHGLITIILLTGFFVEGFPGASWRRNRYSKRWENSSAEAKAGGSATGDETSIDTESNAEVDNSGWGRARSSGSGKAWGSRKSTVDLESFAAGGDKEGGAGTGGAAVGELTSIDSHSNVNIDQGGGSTSLTHGSASASGKEISSVDLESWAGLEGQEGTGHATGKAVGKHATSAAGAIAVKIDEESTKVGSSGAASSVGEGRTGAETSAGAQGNSSSLSVSSQTVGEGELVASGSQSNAGLSNGETTGQSSSFSNARSNNGSGSFAASGAKLEAGDGKPTE